MEETIVYRLGGKDFELRRADLGKFEGGFLVNEYIYQLSLDGGSDDECGNCSEIGFWAGKMEAPLYNEDDEGFQNLTQDEKKFLRAAKGAIITEDDLGFVSVEYFATEKALERAWERTQGEVDEMYEQYDSYEEE